VFIVSWKIKLRCLLHEIRILVINYESRKRLLFAVRKRLKKVRDFHEMWYEHCAVGCKSKRIISNTVQSAIKTWSFRGGV